MKSDSMTCYPAPCCKKALQEATVKWPKRRKTSDGICASSDHSSQNPNSDHEPNVVINGKGYATAFDLSDDKANGCDADKFAEDLRLRRDFRVKYVICNRRMFSSYPSKSYAAWVWRPYTGDNPHESHTHVSIKPYAVFNDQSWFPNEEDDELKPDEREMLQTANHFVKVIYPKEVKPALQNIQTLLREIKDKL